MPSQSMLAVDLILDLLLQIPVDIQEAALGFTDAELGRRFERDAWSANEILAHLRASASVHGAQRMLAMLDGGEPTIHTASPRRWPATPNYLATPFSESFAAYVAQRAQLLECLREAPPDHWQRGGLLTGIRPVRHATVQSEADALVRHEVRHLGQIKHQLALLQGQHEAVP